jgi:hypothetical protein
LESNRKRDVRNLEPSGKQRDRTPRPRAWVRNPGPTKRYKVYGKSSLFGRQYQAFASNFSRHDLIHITPDPRFSRFDGTHKRVFGSVKVLGGVLVLGRIAASDVATF